MANTTRFQRKYDHRLRELVRATGNIEMALKRGVPPSTARGWVKGTQADVVTIDVADMNVQQLQQEILTLRKRVERLVVRTCQARPLLSQERENSRRKVQNVVTDSTAENSRMS